MHAPRPAIIISPGDGWTCRSTSTPVCGPRRGALAKALPLDRPTMYALHLRTTAARWYYSPFFLSYRRL